MGESLAVEFKDLMPWNWARPGMGMPLENSDALKALQADINRAFESFWQSLPARVHAGFGVSIEPYPLPIDVAEVDGEIEITAELPGCREGDIEVAVSPDVIEIKAERPAPETDGRRAYLTRERQPGLMRRVIALPVAIKEDSVAASCKDGILTIRATKSEEAKALGRRIAVAKG